MRLQKLWNQNISYLALVALFAFALSQPLYSILRAEKSFAFFVAHGASFKDSLLIVFLWTLVLPAFICFGVFLAQKISKKFGVIFYAILLALLSWAIFLPLTKNIFLSFIFSLAFLFCFFQFLWLRQLLNYLSILAILGPIYFFSGPSVGAFALSSQENDKKLSNKIQSEKNIVFVLFDQIPLTSLMNEDLQINRELFPNFYRLSQASTWYKNASTLYIHTRDAIPSILTGSEIAKYKMRQKTNDVKVINRTPDQKNFPKNLFEELKDSHRLNIYETVTALAPKQDDDQFKSPAKIDRVNFLLDTSVIAAHQILHPLQLKSLPNMNDRWFNFFARQKKSQKSKLDNFVYQGERAIWAGNFIDSLKKTPTPAFHFLHSVLPHVPFEYGPKGNLHGFKPTFPSSAKPMRIGVDIFGGLKGYRVNFQLHIAQLRFVDLLLGKIMDKMKEENIFDDSILVVTADHGINLFYDDRTLNDLDYRNLFDANMFGVPLFIKDAGQKKGAVSKELALGIDIAPTIASFLDHNLSFEHDGIALGQNKNAKRDSERIPQIFVKGNKDRLEKLVVKTQKYYVQDKVAVLWP